MRYAAIFVLATMICSATAFSQQSGNKKGRMKVRYENNHPASKAKKGKSMDAGTTGVMGRDTVRLSEKGMQRNMNANTGVALPPSSGGN